MLRGLGDTEDSDRTVTTAGSCGLSGMGEGGEVRNRFLWSLLEWGLSFHCFWDGFGCSSQLLPQRQS